MITESVKIQLPNHQDVTFNARERQLNTEIQKLIDSYNKRGYNVLDRVVANKNATFATVNFTLQRMPGV